MSTMLIKFITFGEDDVMKFYTRYRKYRDLCEEYERRYIELLKNNGINLYNSDKIYNVVKYVSEDKMDKRIINQIIDLYKPLFTKFLDYLIFSKLSSIISIKRTNIDYSKSKLYMIFEKESTMPTIEEELSSSYVMKVIVNKEDIRKEKIYLLYFNGCNSYYILVRFLYYINTIEVKSIMDDKEIRYALVNVRNIDNYYFSEYLKEIVIDEDDNRSFLDLFTEYKFNNLSKEKESYYDIYEGTNKYLINRE